MLCSIKTYALKHKDLCFIAECKRRRGASSSRGIPPLHKVLFTSCYRQLITKKYFEIYPNLLILT